MAAIVKSQALEMLCRFTESSVQLAGGVIRAERALTGNYIRPDRRAAIPARFSRGTSPLMAEGGRQKGEFGLRNAEFSKLVTPESRPL